MRSINFILLPAMVVTVLLLSSCSRKEPPVVVQPVEVKPVVVKPRAPEAGIQFPDAAQQELYEEYFKRYLAMFEPPQRGAAVWLRLKDGRVVGGRVAESEGDEIILANLDGARNFQSAELSEESRTRVRAEAFARDRAMRRVRGELREERWPDATNSVARFAMEDRVITRIGPGIEFLRLEGEHTERGQQLTILASMEGWLRIDDLNGQERWIPQYLTYALSDSSDPILQATVERLRTSGLLVALNAETCEADVEREIWLGTESQDRLGIARTLAAHCAAATGSSAKFITIRDHQTKRRLGKYTQSQGWRDMAL